MATKSFDVKVNSASSITNWNNQGNDRLFDLHFNETSDPPIDTFIKKNKELNKLVIDPNSVQDKINSKINTGTISEETGRILISELADPRNINPVLLNLILLGYVSAVESFLRELIRRIIYVDKDSKKSCESKEITFGAANVHTKELLPESLLENTSFASKENILEAFKSFLGLPKAENQYPASLTESLDEYYEICILRHCIVHRFGKLGVKNAIQLDLDLEVYHKCIEKPISIDFNVVQSVSKICLNTVKEINQTLWIKIMERLIKKDNSNKVRPDMIWKWNLNSDRRNFRVYYDIFISSEAPPQNSDFKEAYRNYKNYYKSLL